MIRKLVKWEKTLPLKTGKKEKLSERMHERLPQPFLPLASRH